MRILLAHNSLYYPSFGGGDKSNRLLMEALAARGHNVRVVARLAKFTPEEHAQFLADLQARDVAPSVDEPSVRFRLNGVDVHTLTSNPQLRAYFSAQISEFDPDVIVTSTDDPGQLLFDIARRAARARLVYLVRATIAVPFGPDASNPNRPKTEMLGYADGIVGVSEYVAGYVREWSGSDAIHVPISLLEPGEARQVGRFDNRYVTMVNPCAVKGIAILLALAEKLPHLEFAAIPTWGTSAADLATLQSHSNIAVLEPVDNLDDLFQKTRVVLVPSLWAEARSRVVLEAMLRGIPVLASDVGGLKEAKLGVPYLLPVNPIRHYRPGLDENMVPLANVPEQDIGPWLAVLHRLTSDRPHWEEIAAQSRAAALRYASSLSVEPFERFLNELLARPKRHAADAAPGLSEDKRRLLAVRLKRRAWFPTLDAASGARLRLFCFPHAGAGTLVYRNWIGTMAGVAVIPALLPGRETRSSEAPFDQMQPLIAALTAAIRPALDAPYAFFGHSMGAGIAFELTRSLRRIGAPLPRVLIVSGARAPQLRVPAPPGPDLNDEQLIDELRRLGNLPEALDQVLPVLRADTRLYRNYVYQPEPPLAIRIVAYGGANDPSVAAEHLEAWRAQTTRSFTRREFASGHFYLQTNSDAVLEALRRDLVH